MLELFLTELIITGSAKVGRTGKDLHPARLMRYKDTGTEYIQITCSCGCKFKAAHNYVADRPKTCGRK